MAPGENAILPTNPKCGRFPSIALWQRADGWTASVEKKTWIPDPKPMAGSRSQYGDGCLAALPAESRLFLVGLRSASHPNQPAPLPRKRPKSLGLC